MQCYKSLKDKTRHMRKNYLRICNQILNFKQNRFIASVTKVP